MRSEHNRGASLGAFLLAVSTVTLLMVSPVKGQECTTDADCFPSLPFCIVPERATEGECAECVVSAYPGGNGSCPDIPVGEPFAGPQVCGRTTSTDPVVTFCVGCASLAQDDGITSAADCETVLAAPPFNQTADVVANCQRECFGFYACATSADCPDTLPFCDISSGATEGECVATDPSECVVSVFPGETGSCPDPDQACVRTTTTAPKTVCVPCTLFEQDFGITTAADCGFLENPPANQTADVVANCQRECFGFYACTSEADCPADRPVCEIPQPPTTCTLPNGTSGPCTLPSDTGQCVAECGTNADCPSDRPLCESGQCLAECGTNADCTVNRPLCNAGQCLAGCGTNADCPADRPLCIAGQCVVSSVPSSSPSSPTSSPKSSPLDGMGGGSSA